MPPNRVRMAVNPDGYQHLLHVLRPYTSQLPPLFINLFIFTIMYLDSFRTIYKAHKREDARNSIRSVLSFARY